MIKTDKDGRVVAIVCTRGTRRKLCSATTPDGQPCGKPGAKLCDWPSAGRTCDRSLCEVHAFSPRAGVDYCGEHEKRYRAAAARQGGGVC